ncbi:hypothetical protein MT390_03395 [Vibrio sp. 2-Bac 85]
MQLATLLRNMLLGEDHSGRAIDFAKISKCPKASFFSLDLTDGDNQLLRHLIWPMNTFHIIAKILDTHDVYQKIVSIENETDYLVQLKTGNHAINWSESLLNTSRSDKITISSRFYELLYELFGPAKVKTQVEELIQNTNYLKLLFELYIASDECAYRIQKEMYKTDNKLIRTYVKSLIKEKDTSIIYSLSQCDQSNGVIQFKSQTPQAGISLNSLSHDLAYIKPGIEIPALVGKSFQPHEPKYYDILILPWPLEVKDDFFKQDNKASLQMGEEFGFFEYVNKQNITYQMIVYAIESAEKIPDLVVIPECVVKSEHKYLLLNGIREYFTNINIQPPVIIFGVFGESNATTTYGENSLELLYLNRFINDYIGENQAKHHRWALDSTQLKTYGLDKVLSTDKVKWWENCLIGDRKLISYRDENIHICPLICEDLARQDPIAPVIRSLGPDLVVALLLDGPQIVTRWPNRYSSALIDDPGSSVLSISPYGMTQRSTNEGKHPPSSNVALWKDPVEDKELTLEPGKIGIMLKLNLIQQKQWSADGRAKNKSRLFYANHTSVGDMQSLYSIMDDNT